MSTGMMPKVTQKLDASVKSPGDEDYEILSFEEFCDTSNGSKSDLLTLNDNINYRFYYEKDKGSKLADEGDSSKDSIDTETSLSKGISWKRKATTFAPFGKYNPKARSGALLNAVAGVPKEDNGGSVVHHRYERMSRPRRMYDWCSQIPTMGSTCLLIVIVIGLCIGVYCGVSGVVGGRWGEEHYRRLWERAHPEEMKHPPHAPPPSVVDKPTTEFHYHDHNNLSTRNKNATMKKEQYKKNAVWGFKNPSCTFNPKMKFDCLPQGDVNRKTCVNRGCCWNSTLSAKEISDGVPYCYYPEQYETFHFLNMTENKHGMVVYYEKHMSSGYPDEFEIVRIDIKYLSNDILQIKINDAEKSRFEPPFPELPIVTDDISSLSYRVSIQSGQRGFKVIRNNDNVTIMDTTVGALILSDKFMQITTLLPTNKIYGLGETRSKFRRDMNYRTQTIFNSDAPPMNDLQSLYGSHPFYMALEESGKSHGVLLLNANAMDVVFQPYALTFRPIGGIFNFLLMLGPTPADVTEQYYSMIGYPFMPPYWSLGFHLCKFHYGSLNVTKQVWHNTREAGIPFDTQWNDLDYMNNSNDFTYDHVKFAGLPDFIKLLHDNGMHYMIIVDPGISESEKRGEYPPFDRGLELNIFIKNSTNQPFVGKVWNTGTTVWPDFTNPNTSDYWVEMVDNFHKQIQFDGMWIDMNEPANFLSGSKYGSCEPENMTYVPKGLGKDGLKHKTLCMDAKHYGGPHFNWHSLYGLTEAILSNFALAEIRGRRPFVLSRSSFVGLGHYAAHWGGDNLSAWEDMSYSIVELLNFALFGIPMMGSDICGFRGNTTVELCKRWMQLGAFYPFSRNHNSDISIPQDPVTLGPEVVSASVKSLRLRYQLLPYYYTLFWRSHIYGETVARPMFYEYPTDTKTHDIDTQFLIGPRLLIAPILTPNATKTIAYLPGERFWVSLFNDNSFVAGAHADLNEDETVLFGAGKIIVMQELPHGPITTTNTRSMPFNLIAMEDDNGKANGELYWDDGDSLHSYEENKYAYINYYIKDRKLTSNVIMWGYGAPPISKITIYGVNLPVTRVNVNEVPCKGECQYKYDADKKMLVVNVNLVTDKPFTLAWFVKKGKKNVAVEVLRNT